MRDLTKWTEVRHRMLADANKAQPGEHGPALVCVNQKRGIWRPVLMDLDLQQPFARAESRAVLDLWTADLLDTPGWDGDMRALRTLRITEAGKKMLAEWTWEHGAPDAAVARG